MVMCEHCGEVLSPDDLIFREPSLEDGLRPWDKVSKCPCCGGEELRELRECVMCGNPVTEEGTEFCEDCRELIDRAFNRAFYEVKGEVEGDYLDVISLMFDRAEEVNWYGSN